MGKVFAQNTNYSWIAGSPVWATSEFGSALSLHIVLKVERKLFKAKKTKIKQRTVARLTALLRPRPLPFAFECIVPKNTFNVVLEAQKYVHACTYNCNLGSSVAPLSLNFFYLKIKYF